MAPLRVQVRIGNLMKPFKRLVILPDIVKRNAQIVFLLGSERVKLLCAPQLREGLIQPPVTAEINAVDLMSPGVAWVERDGPLQFFLGDGWRRSSSSSDGCDRDVGFRQCLVEFECFLSGSPCFRQGLRLRRNTNLPPFEVCIRQPSPSFRKPGVLLNGLLKVSEALLEALAGPLVHLVPTSQIGYLRLRVDLADGC